MSQVKVDNVNVEAYEVLTTPEALKQELPLSDAAFDMLAESRQVNRDILDRKDHRMFIVVGPCSIHDTEAADGLCPAPRRAGGDRSDTLYLVMRVYFEKPRTTVGWKGLVVQRCI